jgi:ferredoxin
LRHSARVAEFSILSAGTSAFRVVADTEACAGCEDCVARCQFGALSVPDDVCVVDIPPLRRLRAVRHRLSRDALHRRAALKARWFLGGGPPRLDGATGRGRG